MDQGGSGTSLASKPWLATARLPGPPEYLYISTRHISNCVPTLCIVAVVTVL